MERKTANEYPQELLNLFHEYHSSYRPPALLMAIVIVVTKMVYGLDERRR